MAKFLPVLCALAAAPTGRTAQRRGPPRPGCMCVGDKKPDHGTAWEAWRDGLAAHRQYEHLRSRGVPHEEAIREALGVGYSRSQAAREAAKPLYFAGKA
jgi:hypothetical protein